MLNSRVGRGVNRPLLLLPLLASLLIAACTPDVQKAGEAIGSGFGKIGDGLKDLDVTGVKSLLSQNEDYRKQLTELQRKLNEFAPVGGTVTISGTNRVQMEIVRVRGNFKVFAYVNKPENFFLQNEMLGEKTPALDLDYGLATRLVETVAKTTWETSTGKGFSGQLWDCELNSRCNNLDYAAIAVANHKFAAQMSGFRRNIDAQYKQNVETAFLNYRTKNNIDPSLLVATPQPIDKRVGLALGEQIVYVQLTPTLELPADWMVQLRTYVQVGDKKEPISTITIDKYSTKLNQPKIDTAMPPVEVARFFAVIVPT